MHMYVGMCMCLCVCDHDETICIYTHNTVIDGNLHTWRLTKIRAVRNYVPQLYQSEGFF